MFSVWSVLTILIVQVAGPSHCPTFTVEVSLASMTCQGSGPKKKFAKEEAARRMLARIDSGSETFSEDDIGPREKTVEDSVLMASRGETRPDSVSGLQVLCSREGPGRPQPSYQDLTTSTPPVGEFSIQCSLGSLRTEGRGSSKEGFLSVL